MEAIETTAEIIEFKKNPFGDLTISVIEKVLVEGDLSVLSPKERMDYVTAVCRSLGLNPLTRPLEYIKLNNRLTLYARKDCTDQLRRIYKVSVDELEENMHDDVLTITAHVSMPDGRKDASKGAISLTYGGKKLTGEALANAIMKAETKGKRRATLSICGMGFLDETEIDYVQQQQQEIATGEKVKTERQRGSMSKLKKSETENRGHGDEGMKAVETPVAEPKEKEPKVPYDNYHTKVVNAVQKNSNGKKWMELKVQGGEAHIWNEQRVRYETQEIPLTTLYCWHQSLFEALMFKPEKIVLAVRNQPNSKFSPVIEKIISEEPKPETGTLNIEQQRRDESLLVLSNTLEKLWPSSNEALRPLRNSVGRMLFNLERKEQLRELSYSQDTIDAANKALQRYEKLQEKPQSDAGIINEIEICFKDELQVIAEAKMEPPKDLFSI